MELLDDRQRFPQEVLHNVSDGHVVRQTDLLANRDEPAATVITVRLVTDAAQALQHTDLT